MSFWIRLIAYFLTMWRRKPLQPPFDVSVLHFRAWPTDIDASMHMNNGRYGTIADYGKVDMVVRMGLGTVVRKEKLIGVQTFCSIRFRREIRNWETFRLETRILTWEHSNLYLEHKFILTSGKFAGQVSALMVAKVGLYSRQKRSFIPVSDMFDHAGIDPIDAPDIPESIRLLIEQDKALQLQGQSTEEPIPVKLKNNEDAA